MFEISRNKGFDYMMPKPKEETKSLFAHQLKFKLLNKEFSFTFKVTQEE